MISFLLYLYPEAWRAEYGPELIQMLRSRPITARILADVVWNGFRERAHAADAATCFGLTGMLVILVSLISNFVDPPSDKWALSAVLRDSLVTWPRVVVAPLRTYLYDLLMILFGCWSYLRGNRSASQSGRAALRATFIAGIPVMLAGFLMLSGALNFIAIESRATAVETHGLTYTYLPMHYPWHTMQRLQPGAISVILAPVFALPQAWLFGLIGGWLGRLISPVVGNRLVPE